MRTKAIHLLKSIIRSFGVDLVKYQPKTAALELLEAVDSLASLRDIASRDPCDETFEFLAFCGKHWQKSKAQLFQDLFVQYELSEKVGGFFVEFGAADGLHLSNTYSLEKEYQWDGVLSEPAHCWHGALKDNRDCSLDMRCVWDKSGESLDFSEVENAELSTVRDFAGKNGELHAATRRHSHVYKVDTVTLGDMLQDVRAPKEIDYLSVDTEGSELKILSAFDFSSRLFKIITVEHNYMPEREQMHELLIGKGFRRKFEVFSRWDDWYVRA